MKIKEIKKKLLKILGNKHKDINNDNALDVTSSRLTMKKFHDLLSKWKKVTLEVNNI